MSDSTTLLISKTLGALIILGSLTVKVPLIQNCIRAKSTKGLTEFSVAFELLAASIYIAYNVRNGFPFSTYGELISVSIQNVVLLGCIYYFNRDVKVSDVGDRIIMYLIFTSMIYSLPSSMLFILPTIGMIVSWSGTVPQILTNLANQHTGPLSLITQTMVAFGSLARLFTLVAEVPDFLSIFGSCVGTTLQMILLFQIMYFAKNTQKVMAGEDIKPAKYDLTIPEWVPQVDLRPGLWLGEVKGTIARAKNDVVNLEIAKWLQGTRIFNVISRTTLEMKEFRDQSRSFHTAWDDIKEYLTSILAATYIKMQTSQNNVKSKEE